MAALCGAAAMYTFYTCGFTPVKAEDDWDAQRLENLFLLPLACVTQC